MNVMVTVVRVTGKKEQELSEPAGSCGGAGSSLWGERGWKKKLGVQESIWS